MLRITTFSWTPQSWSTAYTLQLSTMTDDQVKGGTAPDISPRDAECVPWVILGWQEFLGSYTAQVVAVVESRDAAYAQLQLPTIEARAANAARAQGSHRPWSLVIPSSRVTLCPACFAKVRVEDNDHPGVILDTSSYPQGVIHVREGGPPVDLPVYLNSR